MKTKIVLFLSADNIICNLNTINTDESFIKLNYALLYFGYIKRPITKAVEINKQYDWYTENGIKAPKYFYRVILDFEDTYIDKETQKKIIEYVDPFMYSEIPNVDFMNMQGWKTFKIKDDEEEN